MEIVLTGEELELLRIVGEEYLAELRAEIRDTDRYEYRQTLKGKEEVIRRVLEKLGQGSEIPVS